MKKIFISILVTGVILSCTSTNVVKYIYSFENVDQLSNTKKEILFGRYRYLYSDKNVELLFDFDPTQIGLQIKNPTWDTLRVIWDDIYLETDFDQKKRFTLVNTTRTPENILLKDTTIENYDVLKLIKELQKQDTVYTLRPTIILPGMTIVDVLLNKDKGYFLPYEMGDRSKLNSDAEKLKEKNLIIYFKYKVNKEEVTVPLKLKVKDFYIIKQG